MTKLQKWKILGSQFVINNQWCQVRQDTVELSNGQIIDDYFINIRPEIVLILPITPQQEIVFVRQYRHGVGEIFLELPAGLFDQETEDSASAAQRELEEETAYITSQLIPLGILYDDPVKNNNRIHLFIALDVVQTGQQELDITEEIEVVLIPISEIKQRIFSGEISVSGTIAALFIGLDFLENPASFSPINYQKNSDNTTHN